MTKIVDMKGQPYIEARTWQRDVNKWLDYFEQVTDAMGGIIVAQRDTIAKLTIRIERLEKPWWKRLW